MNEFHAPRILIGAAVFSFAGSGGGAAALFTGFMTAVSSMNTWRSPTAGAAGRTGESGSERASSIATSSAIE